MTSNEAILGFKFIPSTDILLSLRSISSMTVDELSKSGEEEGGPANDNEEPLLWNDSALQASDNEEGVYSDSFQDNCLNVEYHSTGVQYLQNVGFPRYYPSLKHLIPVRRKEKRKKGTLGIDEAGLWSFVTVGWLTKFILAAYKKKFNVEDIPQISPYDSCEYNVQRLELLWQNELAARGPKDASFVRVALKFMRTRLIVSAVIFTLTIIISFLGVTVVMRGLLEYAENPDAPYIEGILWALGLSCYELFRSICYSTVWIMNFRTASRIRAACLALMYKKLLRLNSLGDKSVGEMINIFSLDGQRMFELVLFVPLIISGPIVVILGAVYIWLVLSPWALIGFSSFFLFYPLQYALSRLSGYFKGKSVGIIDQRLNKMSEILHCIKLIKMYTWEKIFDKSLTDIREKELSYIKKNAYCTSFSSSLSATVPYISAMLTFLAHIAAGNSLSASQAFSVVAMFLSSLRSNLLFAKKDIRDMIDFFISFQRFKKVLLLNETSIYWSKPLSMNVAVSITEGVFERHSLATMLRDQTIRINSATKGKSETGSKLLPDAVSTEYVQILTDINFFVPKGKLIGICGEVGSGKTSLLNAVLGQMRMTKGKICRVGTCAFVAQQPWLVNATLRQNIIFGEKFNPEKYFRAIYFSCLNEDISQMPGGDETEIGERGINLSGGQKQRVSLARAIYANRDIYLLDDPLSQVDAQIRETLFSRYIQNGLHGKTVLLVTHNIDCLEKCDGIVVMKDGSVVERGTHSELMNAKGEYRSIVDLWTSSKLNSTMEEPCTPIDEPLECKKDMSNGVKATLPRGNGVGKILISEEKRQTGALRTHTLISYMSACGGACISLFVVLLMLFNIGSTAFSNWWLALWLKAGNGSATLYSADARAQVTTEHNFVVNDLESSSENDLSSITNIDMTTDTAVTESATLIMETVTSMVESTKSFLDDGISSMSASISPQLDNGTLLEAISEDPGVVAPLVSVDHSSGDFSMFYTVYACSIAIILFSNVLRGFIMTNVSLKAARVIHNKLFKKILYAPILFFETTPIGRIQNLFSKDTEDIETRLPQQLELFLNHSWQIVFSLFFISLVFPWFIIPLVCISIVYYFIGKIFRVGMRDLKRLEATTRSPIFSTVTTTVLGLDTIHAFNKEKAFWQQFSTMFNLNSVSLFMMTVGGRWLSVRLECIAAIVILITSMLVVATHGQVSAAMAGLALAYATSLSSLFQYITRLMCEVEVKFLAVERINLYISDIQEEGKTVSKKGVPQGWPDKGGIVFKAVALRYRPELPLVLKDMSFRIAPKEKIGIVGRSGSGKSSLVTALFRFVEISSGQIFIDKVDTSTVDLKTLRSKISIIPQDPIILNGTVRYNLDPWGELKDAELWKVLEKAKLKAKVESMGRGLDSKLSQNGDNLSLGERQLLCLARAICVRANIVVLDEATSGVDHETETTVMEAVKHELANCTVLTIAHRLETITSSDKILVIDNGQVCEFGPPAELMSNPDSMFSKLVSSSNRFHDKSKD